MSLYFNHLTDNPDLLFARMGTHYLSVGRVCQSKRSYCQSLSGMGRGKFRHIKYIKRDMSVSKWHGKY